MARANGSNGLALGCDGCRRRLVEAEGGVGGEVRVGHCARGRTEETKEEKERNQEKDKGREYVNSD